MVDLLPVAADSGFTSVVMLDGPGTFLQAYDPASAPTGGTSRARRRDADARSTPQAAASDADPDVRTVPVSLAMARGGGLVLASGLAALQRRHRHQATPGGKEKVHRELPSGVTP